MAIEKITLIAARKMAGLTQQELARRCGVSEGTVRRWENGAKDPTITQARKIGEICGIHYDDIIFLPQITNKTQSVADGSQKEGRRCATNAE